MFERIVYISDHSANVKLADGYNVTMNLMNLHIIFEDNMKKILGEVDDLDGNLVKVRFLGEIVNGKLLAGVIRKPSLDAKIRVIEQNEIPMICGTDAQGYLRLGVSPFYNDYPVFLDVNNFFSNHFAIFGNSGSGKSCGISRLFQNMFHDQRLFPYKANIVLFDSSGEYYNAFKDINSINSNYHYRFYSTNEVDGKGEKLRIPVFLLNESDLALLLQATSHSQLPIIEKTLDLVPILSGSSENVIKRKNDIIARAVQDILLSGDESTKIRDQVTAVLTKFNTPDLNLNSQIVQPGYVRTLKQCLFIDKTGKMQEMELVVEFIRGYILDTEEEVRVEDLNPFYTLADLEMAMEFALINEGILKSSKVFDYANILSVRLHTLVNCEYKEFFSYPNYITMDEYVNSLLIANDGSKCQIVNFNINYVDDRTAKVITKIVSRMLFNVASNTIPRGSRAFHIIIEEAHRYVIKDNDVDLLGYNIFERITKEGRKYGIFLGLITQRPSELSDTCISQCTNFVILRTLHPKDLDYIKNMVPNISMEIVQQLKNLKPGNCIAFGNAFKVPVSMYIDLPNPRPMSNNVDIVGVWFNATEPTMINSNLGAIPEMTAVSNVGNKFINFTGDTANTTI